jgi:cytochrome P450
VAEKFGEAERQRPPVWIIGRRAFAALQMGQYKLSSEPNVLMSQLLMHRGARYFPEPEKFDPDRWDTNDTRCRSLPGFTLGSKSGIPATVIRR